MSKRRIAVLIAMLLAAPAGIAALEQAASTVEATEESQELLAAAAEPIAQPEPATAVEPTASVESAPVVTAEIAAPVQPVANLRRATQSSAFPMGSGGDNYWGMLPLQAAYFDRLEQQRANLVARGDSFPEGTDGEALKLMPRQIAYFERLDQQRVASARAQEQVAHSAAEPRPAEETVEVGSAGLALSNIR